MATYYSPLDPARWQLAQQQRRDNQVRALLNMFMNMQQMKQQQQQFDWKKQTWGQEFPLTKARTEAYVKSVNKPAQPSEWQVKLDVMKQLPPQTRYQAIMKWVGLSPAINYPKSLIIKAAKTLGLNYKEWINADPQAQDNMMKQYFSSISSGNLTPWQGYQHSKSFVNSILKGIDATLQAYEKMGYEPEELNNMPELQNLRKARAFVAKFLMKKKLSPEDIQTLMPYLDIQNIIGAEQPIGQSIEENIPTGETKEFTIEEIKKRK